MIKNIGVPRAYFPTTSWVGVSMESALQGREGKLVIGCSWNGKIKGLEHPQCGCLTNHGGMDLKKEFAISLLNKHNIAVCTRSKN